MKRTTPSAAAIQAAIEFQSLREPEQFRYWLIWLPNSTEPVLRKFQTEVSRSRVLKENRAALAAEPAPCQPDAPEPMDFSLEGRVKIRGVA